MELVRFKQNGGVVSIRFEFTGTVVWRYDYVSDDNSPTGFVFTRTSNEPEPHLHALGHPHELLNDVDAWDVHFANIADTKKSYKVVLAWEQDGSVLHTWKGTGQLAPGATAEKSGDAILVGG